MSTLRVTIHVRPSASATAVGGTHDGAVVVRVVEPADRGKATDAALRAVAGALGVPRRSVGLVRGASSRRKTIDIDLGPVGERAVDDVLARLRGEVDGAPAGEVRPCRSDAGARHHGPPGRG